MSTSDNFYVDRFRNFVALKFQLYNSLFMSLPFQKIEKTGILLSLFQNYCEEEFAKGSSPVRIIEEFFKQREGFDSIQLQNDLLFRFVQYTERQVVLFDALEDAAFSKVNDMAGKGTLKQLEMQVAQNKSEHALGEKLKSFAVQPVLTAHPTQFYPEEVLGIIRDLSKALQHNDTVLVNTYLQQLGKTPFFKQEKPSPYDEAVRLVWFLENVFYDACANIMVSLKRSFSDIVNVYNPVVRMGFWPGGDRDGNPFVNSDATWKVALALRGGILKCYYLQLRRLRRRLTFKGVEELLVALESKLYENVFIPDRQTSISKEELLDTMYQVRKIVVERHDGLFLHLVDNLIFKIHIFGLYFAVLDIRQDSSIHKKLFTELERLSLVPSGYGEMGEEEKISWLIANAKEVNGISFGEATLDDTMASMRMMKNVQMMNGEVGCNRYIISHATSPLDIMQVYALFLMSGWQRETLTVDIVPLIETIEDLKQAGAIMEALYRNGTYRKHLEQRGNTQVVMLGFSDGSKDGGYLMGNWSIYKAKETLSAVSKQFGISVIFFDGRGGPPARGGGKTHRFYAGQGKNIACREIQLTVQGQTISSNFGTVESAQYNLEQLVHAGIANELFTEKESTLSADDEQLLQEIADNSFIAYSRLKAHPRFMDYLLEISPLRFYSDTNIGSRPTKRGSGKMTMDDLRAIPFVASWSQLKQNVTGFYGVGTALQKAEAAGQLDRLQDLYKSSLFFRALIDNCEMALQKCFLTLTAHLRDSERFGAFWQMIADEYELTVQYILKLTGHQHLMEAYEVERMSVTMREKIILPLLTIQQYAMARIREIESSTLSDVNEGVYGKLVTRCSFGIINAARNSA